MAEQKVKEVRAEPFDLRELDDSVYSNCDHELDKTIAEQLRAGDCYAQHAGWDFCAYVWFEAGQWHSYIMRYKAHSETKHNVDLMDLIRETNADYGHN